jgi:hypothetical protein
LLPSPWPIANGAEILRKLCGQDVSHISILPAWAEERLTNLCVTELEDFSLRVLDAQSINEMLDR